MGQGEGEDDEIEVAFAAGAMPPEWRPRLRASGLDDGDVRALAAAIARTHPILRSGAWSGGDVALRALCFLAGPLACLIAVSSGEAEGFVVSLLALGLVAVVTTPVIAVADECERRQAKKTREAARIVLNNFLLPPV